MDPSSIQPACHYATIYVMKNELFGTSSLKNGWVTADCRKEQRKDEEQHMYGKKARNAEPLK